MYHSADYYEYDIGEFYEKCKKFKKSSLRVDKSSIILLEGIQVGVSARL